MAKGDMFLKLEGERSGAIKGEARDAVHGEEIDISGWSWSMDYPEELRSGGRSGRASLRGLTMTKGCDRASTGLMAIMYSNEKLKRAVLSVRKSGGASPVDYLVIKLKDAYVVSFEIAWQEVPVPAPFERFEIRFGSIEIEYSAQDEKGQKTGGTSFIGDVAQT